MFDHAFADLLEDAAGVCMHDQPIMGFGGIGGCCRIKVVNASGSGAGLLDLFIVPFVVGAKALRNALTVHDK